MTVSNISIIKSAPYAGGQRFGKIGSYTEVDLTVNFEIGPDDYAHQVIADLPLCKESDQIVRFSSDAKILIPENGNNKLVLDVPNRGRNLILKMLNNSPEVSSSSSGWEPGNAFLLENGYTLTWCGWQHDVPDTPGLLTIKGPQPFQNGSPISGKITMTIQTNELTRYHLLSERGHSPLPAKNVGESAAILTVQENEDADPTVIDREAWNFGKEQANKFVPDPNYVFLETGFEPGKIYRVTYTSVNTIANGIGLLATRDWVSFLRNGAKGIECSTLDTVYGFGHSQSGRFLRHLIYLGLNLDAQNKKVFDGIIAHAAGARRGEFNQRFAQPSSAIKQSKSNLPPFSATTPDSLNHESLLDAQYERGGVPKLFLINTASEYWWAHASLSHTTPDGQNDLEPDPICRMYFYSGTQHSSGKFPLTTKDLGNGVESETYFNFIDYRPALRALFIQLVNWVEKDVNPSDNKVPRIDNGTLVPYHALRDTYKSSKVIPDPVHIKQISQMEFSDLEDDIQNVPKFFGDPLPVLVPSVNDSFNEYSGITLPEVAAPLGIHLGWNLRHARIGGSGQIIGTIGSSIVPAESLQPKEDYLKLIETEFERLLKEGFALEFDREYIINEASIHYDAILMLQ